MMAREYQQIINDIENSELCHCLGLKVDDLRKGWCEIHLPIKELLLNHLGAVDQKVLYALCDIAAFAANGTLASSEDISVHYSIHISVLSFVSQGSLKITARAIDTEGGGFVESKIWDDHAQLVAVGNIRCMDQETG